MPNQVDEECIFCQIIARRIPAHIIMEDAEIVVFLSLENHPLIVPKQHIPNLYTMPDDVGAAVMRVAVQIANALKRGLQSDGIYVTQANEPAANQDVFHYHMHIYPRWFNQARSAQYTLPVSPERQAETRRILRRELGLEV
jgi:histidine triad (HIT) family protein